MKNRLKAVPAVAVAYARYSSNNQREESIDAQLRAIREHCERNNIVLREVFTDEAKTAQNDDRDDFQRMINGIMKGHIQVDTVFVHKFNRFARSKFDSVIHKKRLKDIGVRVISVTQNIDDTPEGAMLESFLEAMDEYYSANLAAEVRKGLRENALNGKHSGGHVAFGFSLDKDGKYVPNENAPIVKRIFEEFASGMPKTEIVERLNNEGKRNQRGKHFNVRTVYDMLRNEKYIGNFIYTINKTEVIRLDGIITPIIDIPLWNRAHEISDNPVKARMRHKKSRYFLTGKTFCGECGVQICGAGSKRMRDGELYYYYKCVGKVKHKNGCSNPSMNKIWLEKSVLKAVVDAVMTDGQMREIARQAFAELESLKESPAVSTDSLKRELSRMTEKEEKLIDMYLDGKYTQEVLDKKNEDLKKRMYQIKAELEKRKVVEASDGITEKDVYNYVIQYMSDLKSESTSDEEFMHSVFTAFLEKVVVNRSEVKVFVNADFSVLGVGDNRQLSGVIHRLTPTEIQASVARKKHLWGKNEYPEL